MPPAKGSPECHVPEIQAVPTEGYGAIVVSGRVSVSGRVKQTSQLTTLSSKKNRTIGPIHTWVIEDAARKALCGRKRRENMMQAGDAGLDNRRCSAKSFTSAEFPRGGWHYPFGTSAAEISRSPHRPITGLGSTAHLPPSLISALIAEREAMNI